MKFVARNVHCSCTFYILQNHDSLLFIFVSVSTSFRTRGTALQKFAEIIKIVFNPALHAGKFSILGMDTNILRNEMARHYRVHISEHTKPPSKPENLLKKKASKPSM